MPRCVSDGEWLYRKLDPDHWDDEGALPAGFEDRYDNLSFRCASLATPADVLLKFRDRGLVRQRCGTGRQPATAAQMFRCGYRVAKIPADLVKSKHRTFATDDEGNEVKPDGHVDVIQGQKLAAVWAAAATIVGDPTEYE